MKHIITDLDKSNELVVFINSILGKYYLDTYFGDFIVNLSPHAETNKQSKLLHYTQIVEPNCNIIGLRDINVDIGTNFWTLYFDGSKSKEGAGVGCILKY